MSNINWKNIRKLGYIFTFILGWYAERYVYTFCYTTIFDSIGKKELSPDGKVKSAIAFTKQKGISFPVVAVVLTEPKQSSLGSLRPELFLTSSVYALLGMEAGWPDFKWVSNKELKIFLPCTRVVSMGNVYDQRDNVYNDEEKPKLEVKISYVFPKTCSLYKDFVSYQ